MYIGLPWIHERGQRLARLAWDRLAAIDGVEMVTPREAMATLVSFRVAGWPAQTVMDELGARVFAIVRTVAARRRRAPERRGVHDRGRDRAPGLDRGAPRRPHARDRAAAPDADDPGRGMTVEPAAGPTSVAGPRSAGASSATRPGRSSGRCMASLVIAVVLAVAYLVYDLALERGATLPGGDLRVLAVVVYALTVLVVGSVVTYLIVPQPTRLRHGPATERLERRAGVLRGGPDRLAGDGRGDPGGPAAARLRPRRWRADAPFLAYRLQCAARPSVPFHGTLRWLSSSMQAGYPARVGLILRSPRVSIDEQHIALPKLYGAPAYARPAAPVATAPRPFDPDDLPIEAVMTDEERELASSLPARAWAPGGRTDDLAGRQTTTGRPRPGPGSSPSRSSLRASPASCSAATDPADPVLAARRRGCAGPIPIPCALSACATRPHARRGGGHTIPRPRA